MASTEVRVRAYGLVDFTRRGYLVTQAVVLGVTVLLLVGAWLWKPTGIWASNFLFANLFWFFLVILILELVETGVMLRKFNLKKRAR